jgi:hypothetical protein
MMKAVPDAAAVRALGATGKADKKAGVSWRNAQHADKQT